MAACSSVHSACVLMQPVYKHMQLTLCVHVGDVHRADHVHMSPCCCACGSARVTSGPGAC